MNWGQLLFSFEGRVGRATYWYFALAMIVLFSRLGMAFGFSMANVDPQTGAAAQHTPPPLPSAPVPPFELPPFDWPPVLGCPLVAPAPPLPA